MFLRQIRILEKTWMMLSHEEKIVQEIQSFCRRLLISIRKQKRFEKLLDVLFAYAIPNTVNNQCNLLILEKKITRIKFLEVLYQKNPQSIVDVDISLRLPIEIDDIVENIFNVSSTETRYETGGSTEWTFEEELYRLEQLANKSHLAFNFFWKPESKTRFPKLGDAARLVLGILPSAAIEKGLSQELSFWLRLEKIDSQWPVSKSDFNLFLTEHNSELPPKLSSGMIKW